MSINKRELLDAAIKQLDKKYGDGTIMKLDEKERLKAPFIPTGILSLDVAIGIGGFPRGRVVEVYGPESSGKTTITLSAIAQVQKMGGVAAFIDAEHALDPSYAQKIGINLNELYISQPDSGEQALEIAETLIKTGEVDLIVIDSVAALVPRAEIEGNMGDTQIGLQARLMSQALRKITGIVSKSKTCVIFINQLRMKIGGYGNPETTSGGMALKFYSSVRVEVRKGEALKEKDVVYGFTTKIKIAKNKMAAPFRTAEFMVLFDKGPYNMSCILEEAVKLEILKKSGAWYYYGEERIGQGRENVFNYLEGKPELAKKLEKEIKQKYDISYYDGDEKKQPSEEQPKAKGKKASKKVEVEEDLL